MRLRVGFVVCFLAFIAADCRNGLNPGAISNQAPETWITAAPQDTSTIMDGQVVITPGAPRTIPVHFHVYWAGADRDGVVDHYMVAVTEDSVLTSTMPTPGPTPTPPPGSAYKPGAYYATRRTDSLFVFSASDQFPDRHHTLYIYAVDNKGMADPTPARFAFIAIDRSPPVGVFDEASGTGTVYERHGAGVIPRLMTSAITDSFVPTRSFPNDTVPSGAALTFRWHGELRTRGLPVTGYQYKLNEDKFNIVGPSVTVRTYNTGIWPDTVRINTIKPLQFTLRTLDQSGWHSERTRFFQMDFAPDEWFSGPDLADPQWNTYRDGNGHRYWNKEAWMVAGQNLLPPGGPGLSHTPLSPDSFLVLPAQRPERRTFFEVYGGRVWAHQEGDTVSLNSWVIAPSGGTDLDSPYSVKADTRPDTPIVPVLTPGPANGSPIGFRSGLATLKPDRQLLSTSESATYPDYRINTFFYSPNILCYEPMFWTGKCYLYTAAEDGDGTVDARISRAGGAQAIVEDVDAGGGDAYERAVRSKIMVFYVNHKPSLKTGDAQFRPTPDMSIQRGTAVALNVLADDQDPVDHSGGIPPIGGPVAGAMVLTRNVVIVGTNTAGHDTTYTVATGLEFSNIGFVMPAFFAPGYAYVHLSVCDYRASDVAAGNTGRCSDETVVRIIITGPQPAVPATGASQATSRPGFTYTDGRRQP